MASWLQDSARVAADDYELAVAARLRVRREIDRMVGRWSRRLDVLRRHGCDDKDVRDRLRRLDWVVDLWRAERDDDQAAVHRLEVALRRRTP
jgi:hypothetical protein